MKETVRVKNTGAAESVYRRYQHELYRREGHGILIFGANIAPDARYAKQ